MDLLIDGKNCAYRAVFVSRHAATHPVTIMIRFIGSYVERFNPDNLHIFWEGNSRQLWRKSLYAAYKDNRHQNHDFDVEETVRATQVAAIELFRWLSCRQYYRPAMEADDLIYAFCRSNVGKPTVVSSDGDFRQLCYLFKGVSLYDPMKDVLYVPNGVDPLELKCFHGDKSDNIGGYKGIGPKKAEKLVMNIKEQNEFFEKYGIDKYLLNRRLIDLSMCPYVADNILYVRRIVATKMPKFNKNKAMEMIKKHKIVGLTTEIDVCERRFERLGGGG